MNIELLQSSLSSVTIDTAEELTKEYFNENFGYAGIPAIFKNAFQGMGIKRKWTSDYLGTALQEKELVESTVIPGNSKYLTLEEYLGEQTNEYYYKTSRHLLNRLSNDYNTPPLFECWYANTSAGTPRSKLSWLYVGTTGTFSDIHRDIWWSSAWNYLISGTKIWFIYPSVYNESIKREIGNYSLKEMQNIPAEILQTEYRPLICIQQSGDLVFVPGNYYHSVYNLGDTISLTENFVNETNYDMVRSYFRTKSNRNNMNSIEAIIKEGFERKNF